MHVDRLLRRSAALSLGVLALSASAAHAADTTGGATAQTQSQTQTQTAAKPSVKQVQKALGIKADGVMGPKTKRAIKRFQKAHGLKADGVAGPETLSALGLGGTTKNSTLDSAAPVSDDDVAAVMAKIAQCESGGNPRAVSPNGKYRGKYQFDQQTWESVGGTGDPAAASPAEQDARAAQLYAERGAGAWPVCGR